MDENVYYINNLCHGNNQGYIQKCTYPNTTSDCAYDTSLTKSYYIHKTEHYAVTKNAF